MLGVNALRVEVFRAWDMAELSPVGFAARHSEKFRRFLEGRIESWWLPNQLRIIEAIPTVPRDKIEKRRLTRCSSRRKPGRWLNLCFSTRKSYIPALRCL